MKNKKGIFNEIKNHIFIILSITQKVKRKLLAVC